MKFKKPACAECDAYQVIPGNLQTYVSTNRSLLQCKTLPAHFSNNMMVCGDFQDLKSPGSVTCEEYPYLRIPGNVLKFE